MHKWRARYPPESTHPFPEPDVEIDGAPGWAPHRVAEVERWRAGLPGRGAGGGRPSASWQRYLDRAAELGLDRDEAIRLVEAMTEEFPEMTEPQIHDWLIDRWQDR